MGMGAVEEVMLFILHIISIALVTGIICPDHCLIEHFIKS